MSDDYQAAVIRLEQALRDVVAARNEVEGSNSILTHWVALAASHVFSEDDDGDTITGYSYVARDDVTPHYVALGLLEVGRTMVKESLRGTDEDD